MILLANETADEKEGSSGKILYETDVLSSNLLILNFNTSVLSKIKLRLFLIIDEFVKFQKRPYRLATRAPAFEKIIHIGIDPTLNSFITDKFSSNKCPPPV